MNQIGFDARMIAHSGIGTYIREILKHLTEREKFNLLLFGNPEKISDIQTKKIDFDLPIYSLREQLFFPFVLKKNGVKILHVPHYNAPLGFSGRLIVTIHDLIHLKFPKSRIAYFYAYAMFKRVCQKAEIIIADSCHTQKDIIELVGVKESKIRVVYPGFGNPFHEIDQNGSVSNHADSNVLLYVGNVRPTKNIQTLIDAFLIAREQIKEIRLILAGKNFMPQITRKYESHPDIKFLGEVSLLALSNLYKNAKLFVFPSLYEGFGLPPLEAMSCGVPVICSNAASLPEVAGNAAALFDSQNKFQLAELILELWKNETKRKEMIQKGYKNVKKFSWKKCADETAKIYEECL